MPEVFFLTEENCSAEVFRGLDKLVPKCSTGEVHLYVVRYIRLY
jgi:hypothetical protein